MATLVMKFGGSLVTDAERIKRLAQVVATEAEAWDRLVIVASAMSGVTDKLNRAVELAESRDAAGYRQVLAEVRASHLTLLEGLFSETPLVCRDLTDQLDRLLFD